MAIPMPIVQDIRRLDRQGMSRAQIARRLHVDRGTVAKYADMEDCSPKPKADRRYGSKIDPYAHLVDEWLEADRLLPGKQRHTIRRVHDRLLAETDYDGEYSTTMRYVHRWREANRGVPDREGYVRLEWAAGSMQVDFGVARARIAGEMADVHCLVVSLPYSNMRLCVALPGENAECLCHGLMLYFVKSVFRVRGGDVFLDSLTGRRTPSWRSTAGSSATGPWTCTSNTNAAPPT